jgi:hypothetical protein
MDVKTTFLNDIIEEGVYVEQPEGFEVHGRDSHVCKLRRALYGLKHVPRAWYSRIDNYLHGMVFTKSEADSNLYYIIVGGESLILVLYVDDLFLTGSEMLIAECKRDLASEYEMKDLGLMHYFLGLKVWQRDGQNFWIGEVCGGDPKEIQNVGPHAYIYAHGDQLEEARCFQIRGSGPYTLQAVDWLSDVSGQH